MFDQLKREVHHRNWPEVAAVVSDCKAHSTGARADLAAGYRPGYYGVIFTYVVDGRTYDGGLISGVAVQKGDTFPLRYDPRNPSHNSADPLPNWTRVYDVAFCALISALLAWAWLKR